MQSVVCQEVIFSAYSNLFIGFAEFQGENFFNRENFLSVVPDDQALGRLYVVIIY